MDYTERTDFEWSYTQEPHASRRKEILAKYPHIKKLFGPDPYLKWAVPGMVLTQLVMCYLVKDASWFTIIMAAYFFGGVINHAMLLSFHEIGHNLAFGHNMPGANRALSIFGNIIIGIPSACTFKKYHRDHHRYQGIENLDIDIPHKLEADLFKSTLGKLIWVFLLPFFYALRPMFIHPLPVTSIEIINAVVVFTFDVVLVYLGGWKPLIYLVAGSLLSMGFHPMAAHFISEHYMFNEGYETYSYYGPMNKITFNVGYHNEHHDFPYVPWSRLPEVRKIAPEYYDDLPYHTSWIKVLYDFITDPNICLYSRVKRKQLPISLKSNRVSQSASKKQHSTKAKGKKE